MTYHITIGYCYFGYPGPIELETELLKDWWWNGAVSIRGAL